MSSKSKIFTEGLIEVSPHFLSVVPFGIIFGAIGIDLGFGPYITYATSIIIFGGASQIVFLQLLAGGASALVAITSVGVINSRHVLYGAVLSDYLDKISNFKKYLISYFLTDQAFAVSNLYLKENINNQNSYYHILGSGIGLWLSWQIATILGIILGSFIPEELGLKFVIPLTFIAMVIPYLKRIDHVLVMLLSGSVAILLINAPFKSYIILAPLISLISIYTFRKLKK